jgi:hypothetical protein
MTPRLSLARTRGTPTSLSSAAPSIGDATPSSASRSCHRASEHTTTVNAYRNLPGHVVPRPSYDSIYACFSLQMHNFSSIIVLVVYVAFLA